MLPWMPKPQQAAAYLSEADEMFFGGRAGAGKSDLGLGLGLTQHYKTLFLRRQATQLQEIVSRVQDVLRPGDKWKHVGHGGILKSREGRTIEFNGCDNEKDKQKYKGRAHDLKFWDELVDFPESVYLFVNGWNRTVIPTQRCRIVAASNPPTTAEGDWVIRRWAPWLDPHCGKRAAPGELRYYTTIGDKEEEFPDKSPVVHDGVTYYPRSRTFIPGEMLELLRATGYQNTLATLPEPLRSIYLKGEFASVRQDHRWQLIPSEWVKQAQKRWAERNQDLGFLDRVGCDVARQGADWTVIAKKYARRKGDGVRKTHPTIGVLGKKPGKDTPDGQSVIAFLLAEGAAGVTTNVDAIGVGSSVVDVAKVMEFGKLIPIVVSNSTGYRDPKMPKFKFSNVRAAMMWNVRVMLDPEGDPETRLALPPDRSLEADLCAPRYELRASGITVESKDDIYDRIGRSTDAGDAVALACWETGSFAAAVVS